MEPDERLIYGSYSFEMAPSFVENLCTHALYDPSVFV